MTLYGPRAIRSGSTAQAPCQAPFSTDRNRRRGDDAPDVELIGALAHERSSTRSCENLRTLSLTGVRRFPAPDSPTGLTPAINRRPASCSHGSRARVRHAGGAGLVAEPGTSRPGGAEVQPLNWSGRRDSNPRPSPWQGDALPTEPRPRAGVTLPSARPGRASALNDRCDRTLPRRARTREARRPRRTGRLRRRRRRAGRCGPRVGSCRPLRGRC